MLDGKLDQIKDIKHKFDEIEKDRIALRLSDEDGPRRFNSELRMAPTGHFVRESNIFGREVEKEELITMLSSNCDVGEIVHVVTIVGSGGLGKTTLAQLVYNDQRMKQRFDKFGWICVSEDFNVQRLMRETIELIKEKTCCLENLSALQIKISEEIRGKRILLVLDDVWNENRSRWETFSESFMSAKEVKILVTTRNESVAIIMQTVPSFKLGYISKECSWQLFKHYAFGGVNQNEDSKFIKIGEKILKKCGNLPLAIKSVACLLRHELEEERWIDILESERWDTDKLRNKIFKPLQISYAHLPTYLKPCFLYCSMFPKDHLLQLEELVQMWTSQGYIQSNGKNNLEETGREYAKQLWERSFLEAGFGEEKFHLAGYFKLHDVVHDLARLISDNECYSIDTSNNAPDFPCEPYHLYVHNPIAPQESLPIVEVTALRTLIITQAKYSEDHCYFDFSKAHKIRALALNYLSWFDDELKSGFEVFPSVRDLKHLRYLSIRHWPIPQCLHSLSFLRTLIIEECYMEDLTESFGNLVCLEKLVIYNCPNLQKLPTQMGSLTNIRTLKILRTGVSSLPPSLDKIISNIKTFHVRLNCSTIGWLKEFVDIKGTLIIEYLCGLNSVDDGQCANLVSMHNIECLILSFMSKIFGNVFCDEYFYSNYAKGNQFQLDLSYGENLICTDEDQVLLMARLQPHPNLKELHIYDYSGITFPEWMRDTTSCASLTRIVIGYCKNLESLSFGSLCRLKYLKIDGCDRLQFLGAESLPLQLQELKIHACKRLISLPVLKKLKSLVKLSITRCDELQTLMMDAEKPSVELTLRINESLHQNSLGLRNLISLRSLKICGCHKLHALLDEPRPVEQSCEVEIRYCRGLRDWCSHHSIPYKGHC